MKDLEALLPPGERAEGASASQRVAGPAVTGFLGQDALARRGTLAWKLARAYRNNATLLLMALPGVLLVFLFAYVPMFGIIIAFKEYRFDQGILGSQWVGFYNFQYLFLGGIALRITRNTVLMNVLFMSIGTVTAVTIALLMSEVQGKRRGRFYQSAIFLPYFVSWVIVGYFAFAFLNLDHGVVNNVLQTFGAEPIYWFNSPEYWPAILVVASLWKGMGYTSILYLAVMLGISPESYEAAKIDGAGKLQQIWYITMPELTPTIIIVLLLGVGSIIRSDFGLFFNVTRDNPALYPTTDVIDTFVYRALRQSTDLGMSAAAGLYQSAVSFVLVLLANGLVRRIAPERSLF